MNLKQNIQRRCSMRPPPVKIVSIMWEGVKEWPRSTKGFVHVNENRPRVGCLIDRWHLTWFNDRFWNISKLLNWALVCEPCKSFKDKRARVWIQLMSKSYYRNLDQNFTLDLFGVRITNFILNRPFHSCRSAQWPGLWMVVRLKSTLFWYRPHCFCHVNAPSQHQIN